MVIGIKDNATRKKVPNMPKLTLKECIDMRRTHESTSKQIKTMTQQKVSAVSTRSSSSKHHSANKQKKSVHADKGKESNCIFCDKKHIPKIESSVRHGEKSVPHATNQIISQQSANLRTSKRSNPVMSVL